MLCVSSKTTEILFIASKTTGRLFMLEFNGDGNKRYCQFTAIVRFNN